MLSLILPALTGIISKAVDKAIPDKDQAEKIKSEITLAAMQGDKAELEAASKIIVAEAQGHSWLQRNWRPLSALVFTGLIVAHWLGFTPPNLPDEQVSQLMDIVQVMIGGVCSFAWCRKEHQGVEEMNQAGLDLVKSFEGFSAEPYLCPADVWTIGYGTTRYPNGERVKEADAKCNNQQASGWLHYHLNKSLEVVVNACETDLNENQIAALTSFVYNVGIGAFGRSTLLKRINSGDLDDVPTQLRRWNKAGGKVLAGLVRRREAEIELWLSPV